MLDPNVPIFCSGQSLLPTGEVFMAGGTLDIESPPMQFKGARFALTFDPWTEKWTRQPDMREGRWYPGQGQLADGRIVVLSGLDESGTGSMNADLEVFTPVAGARRRRVVDALPGLERRRGERTPPASIRTCSRCPPARC